MVISIIIIYKYQCELKENLLQNCLNQLKDYDVILIKQNVFCRRDGIEEALKHSQDIICLLDADMLIYTNVINRGIEIVNGNKVYFPICYSYSNPTHTEGWWRESAYGTSILTKQNYYDVGGWRHQYIWGGDDTDFYNKLQHLAVRERINGLYHQYHDGVNW